MRRNSITYKLNASRVKLLFTRKIRGECNLCQFNVGNFFRRTRDREREREKLMRRNSKGIPAADQREKPDCRFEAQPTQLFWAHPRRGWASRKKDSLRLPSGSTRPVAPFCKHFSEGKRPRSVTNAPCDIDTIDYMYRRGSATRL